MVNLKTSSTVKLKEDEGYFLENSTDNLEDILGVLVLNVTGSVPLIFTRMLRTINYANMIWRMIFI